MGFSRLGNFKLISLLKQFAVAQHRLNDSAIIDPLTWHAIRDLLDFLSVTSLILSRWPELCKVVGVEPKCNVSL